MSGPAIVGIVVALLVGVIVWAALSTRTPPDNVADRPAAAPPSSQTQQPSDGATPTEDGMEGFMEDYLATASEDPDAAFAMLTPQFQEQSGGIEGYRGFWDQVESADLIAFSADPEALTVTYTVEYVMDDEKDKSHDEVSLALDFADGSYLIAGES